METPEPERAFIERVSERSKWLLNRLWAPSVISALSLVVVALGLFVSTWVGSQNTVIQSLKMENDYLREKSIGLLEETVFKVDTLRGDTTTYQNDTVYLQLDFDRDILLQGGRVGFFPERQYPRKSRDPFRDYELLVDYKNEIEGIRYMDNSTPKVSLRLRLGVDRFEFIADGRHFYLYCEKPLLDSLLVVATIVALDPIYKPTLGVPKK
ncbi:MAG: hypothetical protein NTW07_02920 [candidate division Zixibacteria bacterium]|nr:hypothetical protein [candidate division Zixibacteria bacterium]